MEWPREKVLNTLTGMYLILCTKAFVGYDSFKTLPVGETSCMHCSGVILAPSSTQTQTVFKCWRFSGPLLWTLIFSSFHRFSIGLKSGDWLAILAALFSFSETNWEFPWLCLALLFWWNVHPCFIFIILVAVGTEPANINFHWRGAGLLSNYWLAFHAFLHLPFIMCSILFLCHSILLHIT